MQATAPPSTPAGLLPRVRQWWAQRQQPTESLALTHHNLYILPTRAGWLLAATLLLLLIASINDQLNLGYLLTFWLAGMAVVGLHLTHSNARGLRLQGPNSTLTGFAGTALVVPVQVDNPQQRTAWAIGCAWQGPAEQPTQWHWNDWPTGSHALLLHWTPPRRGWHTLPRLRIESGYPLGICCAWSHWRPAVSVLAYPTPEANVPPWPVLAGSSHSANPQPVSDGSGLRDGVRPYRQGDGLRDIAWKKSASALQAGWTHWTSREAPPIGTLPLVLSPDMTGLADPEQQLRRLCAWVLEAEQRGLHYGLQVGTHRVAPGHGSAHQQHCLQVLALC